MFPAGMCDPRVYPAMSETAQASTSGTYLDDYQQLERRQVVVLFLSILIVALCGITYELIIGAVSSYLLGNSVYQFSLTIGFFMFAMGLGSYLSKWVVRDLLANFVMVEIVISIVGGLCSLSLFLSFSTLNALYTPIMYLFIIVIGALVGLEIPLLTRVLSQKEVIRKSIADVLSLDYIGALIGSIVFPLLLLPQVGLIRASFVIGLANILTAIVNVHFFSDYLRRPARLRVFAIVVLLLLLGLTLFGTRISAFAEHHLYLDQVVYSSQTPYQKIVFTRNNATQNYRMYIDGHIQFSQRDEYRYHEALVHPAMSAPGSRAHVLILGGGDGLAAREVLKYDDAALIHLVDIDPEITRFSREFPPLAALNQGSLSDPRLTVYNEDAFSFIKRPGAVYDRVIIDMPDPHNEALNKLYSKEFYRMIRARMRPDGVLVTQSSSPFYTRRTYWSIEATLRAAGLRTLSYHVTVPAFGVWGFHMAAHQRPSPANLDITVPTRYLNNDILAAATVFGKDIAPLPVPVNSFLEPNLYTTYLEDIGH